MVVMTYLDYSATTPVADSVLELMNRVERDYYANINAQHSFALRSREFVLRYVDNMAHSMGINASNLVFTSGATESNNMILFGLARTYPHKRHIITTPLEHLSVISILGELQKQGYDIDFIPYHQGQLDLIELSKLFREDTLCVSVIAVEGETGLIHPLKEIKALCDQHEVPLHSDMTQAIGKMPINFSDVTYASLSSHKIYGPKGIGACILFKDEIKPLILGGRSLSKLRAGTPPNALIVGFSQALIEAQSQLQSRIDHVSKLRERLTNGLSNTLNVSINTPLFGIDHICNISLTGCNRHDTVEKLSKLGYDVSASSACSGQEDVSKAVLTITQRSECATSSFRVSLSHLTLVEEIDAFIDAIKKVIV